MEYLKKRKRPYNNVDVLNRYFVDDYITAFTPPHIIQPFGANTCRDLGRQLSSLYKSGHLKRSRIGLSQMEPGFPKWVYCYELNDV